MTLTDADRRALLETFVRDVPERFGKIERALTEFEQSRDPAARARAHEMLAAEAHNLRGAAATVGLAPLDDVASALDRALQEPRAARAPTSVDVASAARRVLDGLRRVAAAHVGVPEPGGPYSAEAAERLTVLHIEDNASNLKLVERVLARRPDAQLVEARDGETGLALAGALRPSLILLDLRLPDIPGDEILRRLRADSKTSDAVVVVISAEARPEESDRLLAAGADAFLVKPIDVESLLEVVDMALAKARR